MSKSRRKTRWNLIVILVLAGTLSYAGYKYFFRPTPVNIMAIEPMSLTYGQTTISGGLHKDNVGNFVLVLPDRRVVTLDAKGIDNIVDSPVTISGVLSPAPNPSSPMTMIVQKITATQ